MPLGVIGHEGSTVIGTLSGLRLLRIEALGHYGSINGIFHHLVSSLLALVSPVGLVVDQIALNAIRSQFEKVDQLQVRIDNAPSYQLLQGKVERVRIAGRGLQLKQIRIAAIELETDPINLDPRSLGQKLN
jgi:hypothetical protein